jgi:hypothetical protein
MLLGVYPTLVTNMFPYIHLQALMSHTLIISIGGLGCVLSGYLSQNSETAFTALCLVYAASLRLYFK